MAVNIKSVAEKIFNILKGFGFSVQSYDIDGKLVIDPRQATRFAIADPNVLIRLDPGNEMISLATGKNYNDEDLRKMLKNLAQTHLMDFDFKKFNKHIVAKSEQIDIAKKKNHDIDDVMEGFGALTGGTRTSYQPLDDIRIVVKHRKPVQSETRGARSRNISKIQIQRHNQRVDLPENDLRAARAMARHLHMGGEILDSVGTAISEMAADLRKLREFVRYVRKQRMINEHNAHYVDLAVSNVNHIKHTLNQLCGAKTYANAVSTLMQTRNDITDQDIHADLQDKFTQTHFDNKIADALPSICRSMASQQAHQEHIQAAIACESFDGLRNVLQENDILEFATPQTRLGYQVRQLGNSATDAVLRNHLFDISNRVQDGAQLNEFDHLVVNSCLRQASNKQTVRTSAPVSAEQQYEQFLEQFDIL